MKIVNVPSVVRVVVLDRSSLVPIADTLSAPDGTWRVAKLDPDMWYCVIAFDGRGQYNAAIQDWVKPHVPED